VPEADAGVPPGALRLRLRRIRLGVWPVEDGATTGDVLARALFDSAPLLLDVPGLLARLVETVAPELVAAALRRVDAPAIAAALGAVLKAGIFTPDLGTVCNALLAPAIAPSGGGVALPPPGTLLLPGGEAAPAEERLFAALMPEALLRRAREAGTLGLFRLENDACAALLEDAARDLADAAERLADALSSCALSAAPLLVPSGRRRAVSDLVRPCWRDILIVEPHHWPAGLKSSALGTVRPKSQEAQL
jgi:hypothetical protein